MSSPAPPASDPSRRLTAIVELSKVDDPVSDTSLLAMALDEPNRKVRQTILNAVAASNSIETPTVARAYNQLLRQASDTETHS